MTREELVQACGDVDDAAHHRLAEFVRALLAENERLNLTAIREPASAWRLHVCDSLALLPLIDDRRTASLLDIGTGGGAPGLPVACARPDLSVTLLDATRKKTEAVRRIVERIGTKNVQVAWGRAESLGTEPGWRGRFDAVTSRAVGTLSLLLKLAAPFLRPGGWVWIFKAGDVRNERRLAEADARKLGFRSYEPRTYALPGESNGRIIAVYRMEKSAPGRARPGR